MSKKDGGPAFPNANEFPGEHGGTKVYLGMTLRDWFAGQALGGWLSRGLTVDSTKDHISTIAVNHAFWAYRCADAMMAEREKE